MGKLEKEKRWGRLGELKMGKRTLEEADVLGTEYGGDGDDKIRSQKVFVVL